MEFCFWTRSLSIAPTCSTRNQGQHVFEDLAPQLAFELPPDPGNRLRDSLTDEERAVHDALDDVPIPPDALTLPVEMSPGRLGMVLARLEVKGLATRTPGGYARA
jgi:predicted Rossmann fold nucleotide-binding protein DprA/Smf involved in DNA uptake